MNCNHPNCEGIEHGALCHLCPHDGDRTLDSLSWKAHPCFRCTDENAQAAKCDSREQGHGRVSSADMVPRHCVTAHEPEETPENIRTEVLRSLLLLTPKEYVSLIESVRPEANGRKRDLRKLKSVTDGIFGEDVSLQMVDSRVKTALRKLKNGQ